MIFYGLFVAFTLAGAWALRHGITNDEIVTIAVGALFLLAGIVPMLATWLAHRRRVVERHPPRGETLAFRLVPAAPPRRDAATQQAAFGWVFVVVAALFGVILGASWDKMDEEMRPLATGVVGVAGFTGLFIAVLDLRRRLRSRASGDAFVEIAQHPVPVGQAVKLHVRAAGDPEVVAEAYQRFAMRGTGSDRRTTFHAMAGTAAEVPVREDALVIPADAPLSDGHALRWYVTLRGKDGWERCFALEVTR